MYNIHKYGNTAEKVSTYVIPRGTVIYEGEVAGGTGVQIFLRNAEDKSVILLETNPLS